MNKQEENKANQESNPTQPNTAEESNSTLKDIEKVQDAVKEIIDDKKDENATDSEHQIKHTDQDEELDQNKHDKSNNNKEEIKHDTEVKSISK